MSGSRLRAIITAAYVGMLGAFLAGSFFTEERLWGLDQWGYLPLSWRSLLFGLGLAAIPLANWLESRGKDSEFDESAGGGLWQGLGLTVFFGLCFWIFRGETHFLGNGYTQFTALAGENPIIKSHETGECLLHLWLARALGGNTQENVRFSYQILSIVSGIGYVAVVVWSAISLFARRIDRLLFTLGMLSAGQMLLYFGYVENRSLLAFAIALVGCSAILVMEGKVSRWLLVAAQLLAIVFHIFGVFFVPATIYALAAGSRTERKLLSLPTAHKAAILASLAVIAVGALWIGMEKSLFFRIALLSPFSTRFTVEGYTLLSADHIADYLNLMFLLCPFLPLIIAALPQALKKGLMQSAQFRYLAILILSVLGGAFIFEPKLGMPRDWDLFSFPALPLALSGFLLFLNSGIISAGRRQIAVLAIALGFLSLGARVATQMMPDAAIQQIVDYYSLDKVKSKNVLLYLGNYYRDHADTARASAMAKAYASFPDERLYRQIDEALGRGRFSEALTLGQQAASANPMSSRAYQYIGTAYFRAGRFKEASAALDTALGLNPVNAIALNVLGLIKWREGKTEEGERLIERSMEYGPQYANTYYSLALIKGFHGQREEQLKLLQTAATKSDATAEIYQELGEAYISRGQFDKGAEAYRLGKRAGLDAGVLRQAIEKHPQLRQYMGSDTVSVERSTKAQPSR